MSVNDNYDIDVMTCEYNHKIRRTIDRDMNVRLTFCSQCGKQRLFTRVNKIARNVGAVASSKEFDKAKQDRASLFN